MDAGQTPTPLPDERGDEADSLEVAPAAPAVIGPPRNRLAVNSFRFWLAAVLVFVVAVAIALMVSNSPGQYMALLYYPLFASVFCVPLLVIGLGCGVVALGKRPLTLAIVALILNLVTLPFGGFLLYVRLSAQATY